MKTLVIGLNPSRNLGRSSSLRSLNKWLDILNLKVVSFTNLYEGFEIDEKENKIDFIKEIAKDYDATLALGERVSCKLSVSGVNHFKLPHPSGRNRNLNNGKYVIEQLKLCKNYIESKL